MSHAALKRLHTNIRRCELCAAHLPFAPRPVLQPSATAKIIIIGQAPGSKVQASGIPWDDASGDTLRGWMGIDKQIFYDSSKLAVMPMGFCYPGKGRSGDLPPRPECAPRWHLELLAHMPQIEFTLLIGRYAQQYYLRDDAKANVSDTVRAWKHYAPHYLPIPHPSPRNRGWLKNNAWFERDVVPQLTQRVTQLIA